MCWYVMLFQKTQSCRNPNLVRQQDKGGRWSPLTAIAECLFYPFTKTAVRPMHAMPRKPVCYWDIVGAQAYATARLPESPTARFGEHDLVTSKLWLVSEVQC